METELQTAREEESDKGRGGRGPRTIWSFAQSFAVHLSFSDQPDVTRAGHVELPGCFVHGCSFVLTADTHVWMLVLNPEPPQENTACTLLTVRNSTDDFMPTGWTTSVLASCSGSSFSHLGLCMCWFSSWVSLYKRRPTIKWTDLRHWTYHPVSCNWPKNI